MTCVKFTFQETFVRMKETDSMCFSFPEKIVSCFQIEKTWVARFHLKNSFHEWKKLNRKIKVE